MNYLYYKDAFSALVAENDGVLPDLYEEINFTISCHPTTAPALLTVADVVAYAIIEASHEFHTVAPVLQPVALPSAPTQPNSKLLNLKRLLTTSAPCYN